MKRFIVQVLIVALSSQLFAQTIPAINATSEKESAIRKSVGDLPLIFKKNDGQWNDKVLYQGSSPGWDANVYLMKDQLSFGFSRDVEDDKVDPNDRFNAHLKDKQHMERKKEFLVWNLHFKNSNKDASVIASKEAETKFNYLIGKDESKFHTNVPTYELINYNNIYNNIDIQYYSKGAGLEYDVILKPGGNIEDVQMECEGVKNVNVNEKGQLEIVTAWGTLLEEIPESYQNSAGEKKLVKIRYKKINNTTFGFEITEPYDNALALVVDPINFAWGTYVGGGIGGDSYISDITVDAAGNVYGTGWCNSVYPVTAGSYDPTFNGGAGYGDAYIFKLNPTATVMVYATFLGGSANSSGASNAYEQGEGIAVNSSGQVFVAGWTQSTDFPTTAGAFDPTFNGTSFQDIFVTKLNAAGSALVYSTFVGGMYTDYAYALELNAAGEAYVTGYSTNFNLDFPTTTGVYQTSASTSNGGVYVFELNAAGSAMVFSTFTGNPSGRGYGLALDASGASYITGESYGNMDSTAGAYRTTPNLNIGIYPDVFVQKINSTGTALNYSTYLGGDGNDDIYYGDGIDVDLSGNAYVFGYTSSANFPVTAGSYDVSYSGGSDPFLTKLNPTGTALVYSTFIGGDGIGESVQVNAAGEAFVAGNINSSGLIPTACAYDATQNGATDCFVGKINAAGSNALYLTYVGGSQPDYGNGPFGKVKLVLNTPCEDQVYVCTTSHSLDFPTTAGTIQSPRINGGGDLPVVFHLKPTVTPNFTYVVGACNTVNFTDASTGNCVWQSGPWTPSTWAWTFGDGGTSTSQNPVHTYGAAGTYSVKLIVSCPKDSITISVTVSSSGLVLSTSTTPTGCVGSTGTATVNVTTGTGPFTYSWAPSGGTGSTASGLAAGTYTVTVSNGACSNTATATVTSSGGTPPVTSAITGTSPICANAAGIIYSVTNTAVSTYAWTVPAGATINSGQGTNSINVTWGSTGGTITVTETNPCGTGTPVTMSITVNPPPVATFNYSGTPYCQNASNPSPTFTGGGVAGTFTASPAGLSINAGTGIVNLVGSTTGTYTVTNTIAASGGCPAVTATASITIDPVQSATFTYPSSTFCQSGTNPTATITGTAGGTFSSSPAGLVFVSASTGEIDLAGSSLNTYVITYTTAGPCAASSAVTVTVTNSPDASFTFPGTPYCANASDPSPSFTTGSAGVFSSSPAGLIFVSTATGQVDLSASTPGTYTITNTIAASGGCSASSATSGITIDPVQSAAFSYPSSNYCQAGTDPVPAITGIAGGIFTVTPAGLVFVNSTTGEIDLSATATNTYTVTYTTPGPCSNSATFNVTVMSAPIATFNYAGGPFCQNGVDPFPVFTGGGTPGTFTASPAGLVLDAVDGDVDLSASTAGTYTVTNTIASSGTCPAVTATATITINPSQDAAFTYSSSTYCTAGVNPTPTITGTTGGTFSSAPSGVSFVSTATGQINLSATPLNSYAILYTTAGPCGDVDTFNITITSSPVATFGFAGSPYCQSGVNPTPTYSGGGSAGTFTATPAGLSINASTGAVNLSGSAAGTYTITNTIAAAGGCPAATATSSITITAPSVATFSYTASPYCNAGVNPSPTFSGAGVAGTFTAAPAGLSINSSTGAVNLSASTIGTYVVTNTIPASGGCPAVIATSNIIIVGPPTVTVNSPSICNGQSATLTANGASSYSWSTGGSTTNISVSPSTPTTFTVIGTTSVGCTDTAVATVTILASPTATATSANVCSGQTIVLSATGGGIYSWTGPNSFSSNFQNPSLPFATSTNSGTYTVIVSNGGCADTATVLVTVNPLPVANAGTDVTIQQGSSTQLTATGGVTYSWSPAIGLSCTNCANPVATPAQTTMYCVTVNNGTCTDSSCVTVNVELPCPANKDLAVPNAFSPNGDSYNDQFCLQGWSNCIVDFKIYIYDRWGEKVFESEDPSFCWDGTYHGKILDPAVFVYYIKATFMNDMKVDKKGNITIIR